MLVAQLCLTLCSTTDCTCKLLCPWDSPGKNTGGGCHFLLQMYVYIQYIIYMYCICICIVYVYMCAYEILGIPDGSVGKKPVCNAGDVGVVHSISGSGKIPWRRAWQLTPGFLPGESHGQRSLVGYSP